MSAGTYQDNEWEWNIPEVEDCTDGLIPEKLDFVKGGLKIRVAADPAKMGKVFFEKSRLTLYSYLNRCLRDGQLQRTVGFRFKERSINRNVCDFTGWDFWRVDRETFRTDVYVTLKLTTEDGTKEWKGYLETYCEFADDFTCTVEGMGGMDEIIMEEDAIRLSPYLIPYLKGIEMDELCERILEKYMPGSVADPKLRDAEKLAEKYGLSVMYLPVYRDQRVGSMLFFEAGTLLSKEGEREYDYMVNAEEVRRESDAKNPPKKIEIPANTIVINTNRTMKEYAAFSIYHEIIHYEFHYLFFRLQKLTNNDTRRIKTKEIIIKPTDKIDDPIYWMEKQANRGAYGLMMPIDWIRDELAKEIQQTQNYRHRGELFEIAGRRICYRYGIANFNMRARMIQMGHIEAKGALNWLSSGIRIEPFAFDVANCQKVEETFVIDNYASGRLYEENEGFRKIFDTGKFIYADGHIVRNEPRFVYSTSMGMKLTPWANAHVDQCCLRFERIYIQDSVGKYVLGRMNLDEDYIRKTMFYLEDSMNQDILNEMEAEQRYINEFPSSFAEGLKKLMQRAGITMEAMAEKLHVEVRTLQRWLANPDKRYTEDFIMIVSLILELPDWLSDLLFDRAGVALSNKNPRHLALQWIRRAMWKDGVEKANDYLKQRKFKLLRI